MGKGYSGGKVCLKPASGPWAAGDHPDVPAGGALWVEVHLRVVVVLCLELHGEVVHHLHRPFRPHDVVGRPDHLELLRAQRERWPKGAAEYTSMHGGGRPLTSWVAVRWEPIICGNLTAMLEKSKSLFLWLLFGGRRARAGTEFAAFTLCNRQKTPTKRHCFFK